MGTPSPQHRWLIRIAGLLPLALLGMGLYLDADPRGFGTHEQLGLAPCVTRDWLGAPCPACGVTTAATHLLHGHPIRSFTTQPLGFALVIAALAFSLWVLRVHRRGEDAYRLLMSGPGSLWMRVLLGCALFGWLWRVALERFYS